MDFTYTVYPYPLVIVWLCVLKKSRFKGFGLILKMRHFWGQVTNFHANCNFDKSVLSSSSIKLLSINLLSQPPYIKLLSTNLCSQASSIGLLSINLFSQPPSIKLLSIYLCSQSSSIELLPINLCSQPLPSSCNQ
jgi:hypothetical protein